MARARAPRLILISIIIALAGIACAATREEQVLTRFFEASRALDSTALSRLATVTFNPRTDGSIQQFSIAERGPEQRSRITDREREAASRSLNAAAGQEMDVSSVAVDMVTREVTVKADVRSPEGIVAPGMLTVTLRRAIATQKNGATVEGRWIVTRLQRAPDARTSHAGSSVPRS
jgi:hypothetical protein